MKQGIKYQPQKMGWFAETSQSITYVFEQLRNFAANYGAVLTQFVGILPTIFDPWARMTKSLMPLTEKSTELFRVFRHVNKNLDAPCHAHEEDG